MWKPSARVRPSKLGDHAIEEDLLAAGAEAVGAHRVAKRQERSAERLSGEPVDDLPANGPCKAAPTSPHACSKEISMK
jgi:hypothetical protein